MDNVQIDNKTFLEVFRKVLKTVRRMVEDGIEHPSYFEFLFGMGMTAFAETDVEYIILETGLGGRLDATNAVEKPALSIITSISLDHTAILGDTIRKIAVEKAGIIKPKVPVFFDGSNKEAAEVIRTKGEELGVYCREVTNHAYEIREVHRTAGNGPRTPAMYPDFISANTSRMIFDPHGLLYLQILRMGTLQIENSDMFFALTLSRRRRRMPITI